MSGILLLLGLVVAIVLFSRKQWKSEMVNCEQVATSHYTLWKDPKSGVRFISFSLGVLTTPIGIAVSSLFTAIHWFSLGLLVGAGIAFRLGQLLWPATSMDLPMWDFLWVLVVGSVWAGTFLAEHVRLRRASHSRSETVADMMGQDVVLAACATHAAVSRHRLCLLAIAALGLPAQWHVTMAALIIVAVFWWFARGVGEHLALVTLLPGELERPFLPLGEQIREGVWIAPTGFLLVIGAAALLYFNDLNSFAVALLSSVGCGLVVASERISRLHHDQTHFDELRERLRSRLQNIPFSTPLGANSHASSIS
ncbi:MAG: hypothetical protein N2Z21_05705 [Candidatus Sumerlaeaceae bacterium]|nr:hypothetical protein [Candidatus Sumerlaeaceae bacterium]